MQKLTDYLERLTYPGRGIVLGRSKDSAVALYFIMGRSVNSRNRVFELTNDGIRIRAHDPALMSDPSLTIYHPVRLYGNSLIITNGDHTEAVLERLRLGGDFEGAFDTLSFEPDAPHYTPRISAILDLRSCACRFSILRRSKSGECERGYTSFSDMPEGSGRILHTYNAEAEPLPPFQGEPRAVRLPGGDIDEGIDAVFKSLNPENRVALYMSIWPLDASPPTVRLINKKETETGR